LVFVVESLQPYIPEFNRHSYLIAF
jgi:hypothetical protein